MVDLFEYRDNFSINRDIESILIYGGNNIKETKVSILMPIYNHPSFLYDALFSAINQTCDFNYEIIVVDNNHEVFQEENQKIVEKLQSDKIKYYVNVRNIGALGNWNRCIELSSSPYVTFCHDDDRLLPNTLSTLVACSRNCGNNKSLIIGSMNQIDSFGNYILKKEFKQKQFLFLCKKRVYKFTLYHFLLSNFTNGCGSLYSKDGIISLGGFCNEFMPCPDYALNVFYTYKFGAFFTEDTTFDYRISNSNDSFNCYREIPKMDSIIWKNILKKLSFPSFFLKLFCKANLKHFILSNELAWNKDKTLSAPKIDSISRMILWLYKKSLLIYSCGISRK
ncbi:glycosyltransferase family 2 protein [Phocaeicola sp.]